MHTVALSSSGAVYTWGCNDEGALGRFGPENAPSQVGGLKVAVTDVTAGDSHCVAYNTDTNQMYFWGCYRVSIILNTILINFWIEFQLFSDF